jgi:hypothetical protein
MSSSSPNPGRILRSHAKKPDDSKEKEVKPQAENESEKDKKKRKNKSSHNTSNDDTHDSDLDVKINKPGKKKRKIHTRTAHSDGEQEFVELGTSSKVSHQFHCSFVIFFKVTSMMINFVFPASRETQTIQRC